MEHGEMERRAHILQMGGASGLDQFTQQRSQALFNGQTEYGSTADVIVYSDGSAEGDATAQTLLQTAEADFQATQAWFGGITLPPGQEGDDQTVPRTALPVQVLMDPQAGGAYHFGCNATDIYVDPDPALASGFFVAELVEIFESAINNGWDCGQTNGEGLSRVLAGERNPNLGSLFVQTEQSWWADGRQDYVNDNSADDTNQDANGCATLFLYYLHSQLGYDWTTIVTTGGASLGQTYQQLTGQDPTAGFADFVAQLSTLDMGGFLNVPASGNPFPISAPGASAQPQPGAAQGEPVPVPVPVPVPMPGYSPEAFPPYESAMPYGALDGGTGGSGYDPSATGGMDDGAAYGAVMTPGAEPPETEMPDMAAVTGAAAGIAAAAAAERAGRESDETDYGVATYDAPAGYDAPAAIPDAGDAGSARGGAPQTYEVYETQEEIIYPPAYAPPSEGPAAYAPAPSDQGPSDQWSSDQEAVAAWRAPQPEPVPQQQAAPYEVAGQDAPDRDEAQQPSGLNSFDQREPAPARVATVQAPVQAPVYQSAAPAALEGVETMIGVVVVLIILVLLALVTVLFYGGVVSL